MELNFKERIRKVSVVDDRLIQKQPTYGVDIGPSDIKINKINASSSSSSNIQVLIQVPTFRTMVDRYIPISCSLLFYFDYQIEAAATVTVAAGSKLITYGREFGVCAFPIHSLINDMQVTINNEVYNTPMKDIKQFIYRMLDHKKLSKMRASPHMLDKFTNYGDASLTSSAMNILAGYLDGTPEDIPNGAYPLYFTDAFGNIPVANTNVNGPDATYLPITVTGGGLQVNVQNALVGGGAAPTFGKYRVYCRMDLSEPVMSNGLCYDALDENENSLFEVNNIEINMNIVNGNDFRIVRFVPGVQTSTNANIASSIITAQGLNSNGANNTPFQNLQFTSYFLTPPLTIKSPPECVLPYNEIIRYNQDFTAINAGQNSGGWQYSPVIPLSGVPDLILLAVYPKVYNDAVVAFNAVNYPSYAECDWFLQINQISIDFGGKQTMLTLNNSFDNYRLSWHNGLRNQDYLMFNGQVSSISNGLTPTAGPVIALKPCNIGLTDGLAAGIATRTNMQIGVQYTNQSAYNNVNPRFTVALVNSGFSRYFNGMCEIVKFPVSPADVIDPKEIVPEMRLKRMIGGGALRNLNNMKLHHGHHKFKAHHKTAGVRSGGVESGGMRKHSKKHSKTPKAKKR